jgi:hypothetical protein
VIYISVLSREKKNPRLKNNQNNQKDTRSLQNSASFRIEKKPKTSHIIAAAAFPLPSVAGLLN